MKTMPEKKYLNDLTGTILRMKTKEEVKIFLEWILTPQEFEQIPLRLQIVKMLKEGTTQREISKKLGVGIATVTRGAKEYKKVSI